MTWQARSAKAYLSAGHTSVGVGVGSLGGGARVGSRLLLRLRRAPRALRRRPLVLRQVRQPRQLGVRGLRSRLPVGQLIGGSVRELIGVCMSGS